MARLLILLPDPRPSGVANSLRRAAALIPPDRYVVAFHTLAAGRHAWKDAHETFLRHEADVVHTVGTRALRAAAATIARFTKTTKLVATDGDSDTFENRFIRTHRLDIPPCVDPAPPADRPADLPARFVLAAGGFDHTANLKAAVWAFDVLKYTDPDLHLVVAGDGGQRAAIEEFSRSLAPDDHRVHYLGERTDIAAILPHAELVFQTHVRGGQTFTLEAMAAGRTVVAMRTREQQELIRDGANGRLVPAGDPVQMAAVARQLRLEPDVCRALGEAARTVAAQFPPARTRNILLAAYDSALR